MSPVLKILHEAPELSESGSSTAAPFRLADLQGFRTGTDSWDFITACTLETNVLYIFREKRMTVHSQSARKSDT